ncbi:hypothetical protein D8Y22_21875 [Salinadaptatus halalkaliphilus]|uniref:Uncharacterized protein n=1 Tax=Salinadaptatus halalkaliphilus TaxID=2419781 RepID=A0A4S3TGX0_9EURY|nr:hypothetical protein [Salinadaptatus halalkaliphilus]THE62720.1 hypothetical protein D8Y22_21875 [Salinadaptatus halalkaliphilus]
MDRRTVLAAGSSSVTLFAGCLGEPFSSGGDTQRDGNGGESSAIDVILYNYRDVEIRVAVDVIADGDSLVSETVELGVPSGASTNETVATVPAGTAELEIDATVEDDDSSATERFDLPFGEPVSAIEIRVDERLEIAPLPDEQPAPAESA